MTHTLPICPSNYQVMHLAVVAARSPDMAFMATTAWSVVNLFFSGFFVDPADLALPWLSPLHYLSAVRWVGW